MSIELRHTFLDTGDGALHVVEAGDPHGRPYLFLHGWPESWQAWRDVMTLAAPDARAIAIDLPGVGRSAATGDRGVKRLLAARVHELIRSLDLTDVTLVGHDAGGMVAYAYLRRYPRIARVVIMNTAIPGVEPWTEVLKNPYIWHFGLHNVPTLPETLVQGHQAEYFGYFYDVLSADPSKIGPESRAAHAAAYDSDTSLTAGFDLYRAFAQDAHDNTASAVAIRTPLLYLRGRREQGDIATYESGFRAAGIENLTTAVVPGAGHFAPEEAPAEVWRLIREFAGR
ncbi:alpha/beta hydrolase [Sphaerisporangium krabiense]|uniref:Pimeloyl-ACP methyl ester carboxylesterase n=1 Tax=Sphaerisporangium krabiense TaxID=763782 RepID=A0A7W8Z942_9ACTN|nr:alpha/beta hydrolase [Sphaerisporangium krabiense]MBB5629688.1 pimeloyl-ACP methyl ester carboxylesterase [Sphaerisporangium krabiense]GII63786.1 alpha/beta hydrolase [Sphaerisporangium krabiense]